MMNSYVQSTTHFETILDYIRFGLSQALSSDLYYGHGTDNAWDEIIALVLGSLSLPYDCNTNFYTARLTAEEKHHIANQLWRRIMEKKPVAYLTKEAYFCNRSYYVDERVLIPRSPLAELIQQEFSPWIKAEEVERVLDLGTGSGCIAIALSDAFPEALIDATDISADALEVAAINLKRYGLEETICLRQSDCWQNVPKTTYDLIVSNPPYVGKTEMQTLPLEYSHEPQLALEAANNGLAIVEKILASAHHYLSEKGILVVEVGNSEDALVDAYPELPFTWLEFKHGGQGVFLLTREQLEAHFE